MKPPRRGDVWLVDLGLAAKVRPCLVVSVPAEDSDRALVTLIPHTTSLRGTRFEAAFPVGFLRPGGFDAQGILTVPWAKLVRPLGSLHPPQMQTVEAAIYRWLGLEPKPS